MTQLTPQQNQTALNPTPPATYPLSITTTAAGVVYCNFPPYFLSRSSFKHVLKTYRINPDQRALRIIRIFRSARIHSFAARYLHYFKRTVPIPHGQKIVSLLHRVTASKAPDQTSHIQTIADEGFRAELEAIEIPEHLNEPERFDLDASIPTPAVGCLVAFFILAAMLAINKKDWFMLAIFLINIITFVSLVRPVRQWLRATVGLTPGTLIRAPGVVIDRKDRRWTVDDSIMFINRGWLGGYRVRIIGPTHHLRLPYRKLDHPDFITLWQNWNHPHPRPELLT